MKPALPKFLSFVTLAALAVINLLLLCSLNAVLAANHSIKRQPTGSNNSATVYPQFALNGQYSHWIKEQMPIKVWVAHGTSLDGFLDSMGTPRSNTANTGGWPDLVIEVMANSAQLSTLPRAPGYSEQQYQAAIEGISLWKALEKEGLFNYILTDNPEEADVYVFWTNHFVNKLGLALFENDIRGYTSAYSIPVAPVMAAMQRGDLDLVRRSLKPVVTFLRTQEQDGSPISYVKMKASAAHEFGHALGIAGHSPYPGDLMSVYYGRGAISINDAATMRYLYRAPAQLMP